MAGFWIEHGKVTTLDLGGFNELRFCRHGPMLYNKHDQYVGRSLQLYGEYNRDEWDVLSQLVDPDDIVFEIGANCGAHTVPLAKKAAVVYAFEPQRIMFQLLCANVALNHLSNVEAFPLAVGKEAGSIAVPQLSPEHENNFGALELGGIGDQVGMVQLTKDWLPPPSLIKIDVEGMELDVLRGAENLLLEVRPLLYVENDREEKGQELIDWLREREYRLHWHRPPLYSKDNFAGSRDNVFPGIVSQNMLCVPQERVLECNLPEVELFINLEPLLH